MYDIIFRFDILLLCWIMFNRISIVKLKQICLVKIRMDFSFWIIKDTSFKIEYAFIRSALFQKVFLTEMAISPRKHIYQKLSGYQLNRSFKGDHFCCGGGMHIVWKKSKKTKTTHTYWTSKNYTVHCSSIKLLKNWS